MYNYEDHKGIFLTNEGQEALIMTAIRARSLFLARQDLRMDFFLGGHVNNLTIHQQMAVVDRLVELGFLVELRPASEASQHRMFFWRG